jgi:hypothetical protein
MRRGVKVTLVKLLKTFNTLMRYFKPQVVLWDVRGPKE